LVWLNLLSLGTKGLTEPTIGIQSGLCHGRGLAVFHIGSALRPYTISTGTRKELSIIIPTVQ
jgi:hypothetical protein